MELLAFRRRKGRPCTRNRQRARVSLPPQARYTEQASAARPFSISTTYLHSLGAFSLSLPLPLAHPPTQTKTSEPSSPAWWKSKARSAESWEAEKPGGWDGAANFNLVLPKRYVFRREPPVRASMLNPHNNVRTQHHPPSSRCSPESDSPSLDTIETLRMSDEGVKERLGCVWLSAKVDGKSGRCNWADLADVATSCNNPRHVLSGICQDLLPFTPAWELLILTARRMQYVRRSCEVWDKPRSEKRTLAGRRIFVSFGLDRSTSSPS